MRGPFSPSRHCHAGVSVGTVTLTVTPVTFLAFVLVPLSRSPSRSVTRLPPSRSLGGLTQGRGGRSRRNPLSPPSETVTFEGLPPAISGVLDPIGLRSSAAAVYASCTRPAETVPSTSGDAVTPYQGSRRPSSAEEGSSSARARGRGHARAATRDALAAGGTVTSSRRRSDREARHEHPAQAPQRSQDDPGVFPRRPPPTVVTSLRTPVPCGLIQEPLEASTEAA